jgi:A/G-specific adenine glycosylase
MKLELLNNLNSWYLENHRELPWRNHRDAYRIWISEIMLQQTTVTTVIPYFEKFINRFPDLSSLAVAKENEVLKHWTGLGYYSRAKNIHKSAKLLVTMQEFPNSFSELMKLPGIGEYTSRAISSIAFDEAVGVLDGNVIRILARFHKWSKQWWKTENRNELQNVVDGLNQKNFKPHIINQALMELGATICLPKNPKCETCPWRNECKAFADQSMSQYPIARPKQQKQTWLWETSIIINKNKFL